tara:strand:- start:1116 stop:2348 length:1233 start_codon:yes stop_codon:yes gene_type:complete
MTLFTQVNTALIIATVIISLAVLFQKKVRLSPEWRATVTPLASIIGSGFLVSAPLLLLTAGKWAAAVMLLVVIFAYGLGSNIRFNIRYFEPILNKGNHDYSIARWLEALSKPALGLAYIISVSFYLKLLSAFALRGAGISSLMIENILSTCLLLIIGLTGRYRGLAMLESYEIYGVNIKLAIIAAVIVGHLIFNMAHLVDGSWHLQLYAHDTLWRSIRKLLGILIIVQGFETSRFLGQAYNGEMRIRTMRYAQWISGIIYFVFISSTMIVFNNIHSLGETTVIDLCRTVSPFLPLLLIMAAVMSQFSAAVADTVGSGGLLDESSNHRIGVKNSYLVITLLAVALTWLTNIYGIVVIASKAFAVYYALQLSISISLIINDNKIKHRYLYLYLFVCLFIVMMSVIIFGISVE